MDDIQDVSAPTLGGKVTL